MFVILNPACVFVWLCACLRYTAAEYRERLYKEIGRKRKESSNRHKRSHHHHRK